jgi:hypothetical protein
MNFSSIFIDKCAIRAWLKNLKEEKSLCEEPFLHGVKGVASFIMFFIYLQMHKKARLLQGALEMSWVTSKKENT